MLGFGRNPIKIRRTEINTTLERALTENVTIKYLVYNYIREVFTKI